MTTEVSDQNIFALFDKRNPAEAIISKLRCDLAICLIQALRADPRPDAAKARSLKLKMGPYRKILGGDLSEFTLDDMIRFNLAMGRTIIHQLRKDKDSQMSLTIRCTP